MKRILKFYVICAILISLFSNREMVSAEAAEVPMDFIFVIDHSNSMKKNDPNKYVFNVLERIALLDQGGINRIGYVVYNDSIIKDKGLTASFDSQGEVAALKSLTITNGTDVGLGMKTAHRLLAEQKYQKGRTAMILLSDGDVEVSKGNPNRSQASCDQDIREVLENADYPIYTIQYSEVGKGAQAPMNSWGAATGGKDYAAATPEQLQTIADEIYEKHRADAQAIVQQEEEEKKNRQHIIEILVTYPKDEIVSSITVTLEDKERIQEVIIPPEYEEVKTVTKDQTILIEIDDPQKEQYTFFYTTSDGEPVSYQTLESTKPEQSFFQKWWKAGLLILLFLIAAGAAAYWIRKRYQDRKQYYFTDALECYFMNAKKETPIQNWNSQIFQRKKKTTLHHLLREHEMLDQLDAASKVQIEVGKKNTLRIMNNSAKVVMLYQGKVTERNKAYSIRSGENLYLTFITSGLELELRVRKTGNTR